jgi:hypothetical protein
MSTVTKMRLSKETFNILKNFAGINSNIMIQPGNVIRTKSLGNNIYAEAKVTEDFDATIPLWDLNQFLGVISMFNTPDLEFDETHVTISNGKSSITYHYAAASLLNVATKAPRMGDANVVFDIGEQELYEVLKAASILQVDQLEIEADGDTVSISVLDSKQNTKNSFKIDIPAITVNKATKGRINIAEMKLIPGAYTVELTDTVVSKFTHKTLDLFYNLAIQKG